MKAMFSFLSYSQYNKRNVTVHLSPLGSVTSGQRLPGLRRGRDLPDIVTSTTSTAFRLRRPSFQSCRAFVVVQTFVGPSLGRGSGRPVFPPMFRVNLLVPVQSGCLPHSLSVLDPWSVWCPCLISPVHDTWTVHPVSVPTLLVHHRVSTADPSFIDLVPLSYSGARFRHEREITM